MTRAGKLVVGHWRITRMEVWDKDYLDMEVPAHLTIGQDLTGTLQFGLVQGGVDARVSTMEGEPRLEFSWSGFDENTPTSGCGWMTVSGDRAEGRLFTYMGDDSSFSAVRQGEQET